jgi:hypothetical protein
MLRTRSARLSVVVVAVLAVLPLLAAPAAAAGIVEGAITTVDLHGTPRHITIRQASGADVDVRIHVSTHLNFLAPGASQVSPELSNLRQGMQVRAAQGGRQPSPQIDILSVPQSVGHLIQRSDSNADPRVANAPSYSPLAAGSGDSSGATGDAPARKRR